MKDPSDVPDPYVILYLLPKRSKETKRKTIVVKNSCDPVFETTFEYGSVTLADLKSMVLEVTVKSKMNFLSGGSLTIGMVCVILIIYIQYFIRLIDMLICYLYYIITDKNWFK